MTNARDAQIEFNKIAAYGTRVRIRDYNVEYAGIGAGYPDMWFKFNETTGTVVNDTVLGASGVFVNGSNSFASGKINNALHFEEKSRINMITSDGFFRNASESFTYTFWTKPGSIFEFSRVFEDSYTNWYPGHIRMASGNNIIVFNRYDGTKNPGISPGNATTMGCPAGEYTHIGLVYDNGSRYLFGYKNGSMVCSGADTTDLDVMNGGQTSATFGNVNGLDRSYLGDLDDFRFYKKALRPHEMESIYNGGTGTEETDSSYDDDITIEPNTDTWISGLILPIDKTRGSSDAVLIQSGRLQSEDSKLYINGSVAVSGIIRVSVGSPIGTGDSYSIIDDGIIGWDLDETVYKKLYIRKLPYAHDATNGFDLTFPINFGEVWK